MEIRATDKLKLIADMAEMWTSAGVQDNLTAVQRQRIEEVSLNLVRDWKRAGIELSVDCIYMLLAGVVLQAETDKTSLSKAVSQLVGGDSDAATVMPKLIVGVLSHRLLNDELRRI